jgi:non-ribosomal peptide synthetase-like protein
VLDYVQVGSARCSTLRRATYAIVSLLQVFLLYVPFGVGGLYMVFLEVPALEKLVHPADIEALLSGEVFLTGVLLSLTAYIGTIVVGLVFIGTVPRALHRLVVPDTVYPLYGLRYSAQRAITRFTNSKTFLWMFGDSSYVVPYLSYVGYDLTTVEQTGSNFGSAVRHETPFHVRVGQGTMVADGLSVVNANYSATAFRVSQADIGAHSFLGNLIPYPAGGRTGDDCLLATKVSIPLDGPVQEGVGLLGSPSFRIPRSVERDRRFDHLRSGPEHDKRLAMKNRYNLRSMALHLTLRWMHLCVVSLIGLTAVELSGPVSGPAGWLIVALALASVMPLTALYFTLVERTIMRFRPLQPQLCSIYDPYFWWHERTWKIMDSHLVVLNGTPFKNLAWRMLGVRIGKRVFDDGVSITERSLTVIGDDCTLAAHSKVQCHSQEDGTFKSDRTTIGNGCTIGTGALVHYGVTIGDHVLVAADSFVMKGEDVPAGAVWGGNPATQRSVEEAARW